MFKLKVANSKFLRDMVTAISILVDEATFKIEPDGLKLSGYGSLPRCNDRF